MTNPTTNQTISQKTFFFLVIGIGIIVFASVGISSYFNYLVQTKRILSENEIESKRIEVESKRADTERENIRLNATTSNKVTLDKMTNCMKIMMEESRNNRNIPMQPKEAKELCKDLQKI